MTPLPKKGKGGRGKWNRRERDKDEPPRNHDYRRELEKVVWPKYDGDCKYLRGYRKQIDMSLARLTPGAEDYVVPFLLSYTTKDFQLHFDREEYKPEDFNGEGKLDEFFKVCKKLADVHPVDELYENMTFYMNTFKQKNEDDMKAYIATEKIAWERLQEATSLMNLEETGAETDSAQIQPLHSKLRG